MSLALRKILVNGVKIISKVTDDAKDEVTLKPWIGDDTKGNVFYASSMTLRALVSKKHQAQFSAMGGMVQVVARVQFVDSVPSTTPNAGEERVNPIDPRDIITLSDGTTAPIIADGGFVDRVTSQPYAIKVTLGNVVRGQ
jgi:hypothetical protein